MKTPWKNDASDAEEDDALEDDASAMDEGDADADVSDAEEDDESDDVGDADEDDAMDEDASVAASDAHRWRVTRTTRWTKTRVSTMRSTLTTTSSLTTTRMSPTMLSDTASPVSTLLKICPRARSQPDPLHRRAAAQGPAVVRAGARAAGRSRRAAARDGGVCGGDLPPRRRPATPGSTPSTSAAAWPDRRAVVPAGPLGPGEGAGTAGDIVIWPSTPYDARRGPGSGFGQVREGQVSSARSSGAWVIETARTRCWRSPSRTPPSKATNRRATRAWWRWIRIRSPARSRTISASPSSCPRGCCWSATAIAPVGLMLQKLPGDSGDEDGWTRVNALFDTLTDRELQEWPVASLLHRLFHQDEPGSWASGRLLSAARARASASRPCCSRWARTRRWPPRPKAWPRSVASSVGSSTISMPTRSPDCSSPTASNWRRQNACSRGRHGRQWGLLKKHKSDRFIDACRGTCDPASESIARHDRPPPAIAACPVARLGRGDGRGCAVGTAPCDQTVLPVWNDTSGKFEA